MSNLLVSPKWNSFINKVDAGEEISGGDLGNANIATRQLAENVMFLRDSMFTLVADATGDLSQAIVESNKKTKDEFDIVAGLIEAQNEIIIAEAQARKEAISASNTKIAEEAAARVRELGVTSAALQQEIDDRKEAFRLEHISRAESEAKFTESLEEVLTEAEASVKKVENLSSQLIGGYDGSNLDFVTEGLLFQQKNVTSTAIKGMAEQISMLSAGVGEQFDTAEIWHFDKDKEDWINGVFDVGYLTVKSETVTSPSFLVDGDVYHHLKMRINKVGDPDWAGKLVWNTGSIALPEPVFVDDVTLVTLDTTWSGDITQLQLKLSTDADDTNYYKIDWITIGRPSPGASTASVLDLKIATATRDEALAQDIRGLSTKMDTDNALLSSNVNAKLETITTQQQTQATDITTLSSNVDTMNTKLSADIVLVNTTLVTKETALAESIAALTSKTNASEVSVLTQLQTLTDVDSALGTQVDALSASFDTAAAGIIAQNLVFTAEDLAQATQISQLTAKVEGNIAEVNTQIETLTDAESANANKFTSISAEFKALGNKTDASDAEIRVNAADIIEERNARATDILAQATRIDVLTTEVGENAASATTRINLLSLEDSALAERLDVLTASTDDTKANINLRLTALADEDSAFSEQLTQVMAAVDDNDSAVHERVTALTTATDAEAEKLTLLTAEVGANSAEILTTSRTAATNSGAIAEFNTRLTVDYLPKVENIESNILNAVKQTDVQYYLSISETQPLGGEWLTLAPTWEPSKYMFQRMETTYVDGTVKYTPGVNGTNISGAKGDKGLDGKDGSDGVAGLQGPSGVDGLKGPAGKDGESSYTHLAYATSKTGIGFSTGYFETATYIGMYVDNIKEDSENYAVYNWSLIKGADGAKGIPGVKGSDGNTSYLHIAYANSPDGADGFSTTASIGKTYIGQYTDFLENDSTSYALYSWTLIKGEKGDQGPIGLTGLTGLEGPKGDKGIQGPAGPIGPIGPEGLRGLTGLEGLQGDQGIPGEKGEDGLSSYTHLAYATSATGTNFNTGHFPAATYIGMYVDNEKTDSIVPSKYKWSLIKGADGANGIAGPKGPDGKTSYLHIAYANNVTGNIGFSTTVSDGKTHIGQYTDFELVDSPDYTKYKWTLIKGDKGDTGPAGLPGVPGIEGKAGANGIQGPKGADGTSSYTHLAYATSVTGTNFNTAWYPTATYIGMYVDRTETDSVVPSTYNWSLIKGADGANGIAGPKGTDGKTTYLHIAYANSEAGDVGFSTTVSAGKAYIGQYTDTTLGDSEDYSIYTWSLIKGADGISSYAHLAYATSADGTNFNTNHFQGATYIGMYVDNEEDDSKVHTKYNWSLIKGADGANGIPGPTGEDGKTSYLHVAYATSATGAVGFSTTVSTGKTYIGQYTDFELVDSPSYTKYKWSLIKGDKGDKGDQGPIGLTGVRGLEGPVGATGLKGDKGANGLNSYTHLAYATSPTGLDFSTGHFVGATYIGMYVDNTEEDSKVYTKYNWSLIKGADGDKGIAGPTGADGKTAYLHIAYATSATGNTGFSTTVSEGKTYIGQYTDNELVDSPTYTRYKWSLIKGEKGDQGIQGPIGLTGVRGLEGPKGDQGIQGPIGPIGVTGPIGPNGQVTYTWIAYADDIYGAGLTTNPNNKLYIGIAANKSTMIAPANTSPSAYVWSIIKGGTGTPSTNYPYLYMRSGYVKLPDLARDKISGTLEASIELWIKKEDLSYGFLQLSGFASTNGCLYPYQRADLIHIDTLLSRRVSFYVDDVREWHHVAITRSSDTTNNWRMYQNGELKYTTTESGPIDVSYLNFEIGRNSESRTSNAKYRDVRLWNKALTQHDIQNNMNRVLNGDEVGLVGYWKFDELSGITIKDSTINKFHGTIINESGVTWTDTIKYTWVKYATSITGDNLTDNPENKAYIGIAYNKPNSTESLNPLDYNWSLIKGADGLNSYTHLAYATSVTGALFSTSWFEAATYIGMYADNEKIDSTVPSKYNWSLIKGADGANGIPGPKGTDGKTAYLHIAYATSANGSVGFSTTISDGKTYIGQYTDNELVDSPTYTRYKWSLIKGEKGDTGPQGPIGLTGVRGLEGPKGETGLSGAVGAVGQGVDTITSEYAVSTSKTVAPTTWTTVMPVWSVGNYVWTRSKIVYKNPVATSYTTAIADSSWEAVNELQVGGKNLIENSSNSNKSAGALISVAAFGGHIQTAQYNADTPPNLSGNSVLRTATVAGTGGGYYDGSRIFLSGGVYSVSYWVKGDVMEHSSYIMCLVNDSNAYSLAKTTTSITAEWSLVTKTITVSDGYYKLRSIIYNKSITYISHVKLEKGNIATDWTPAPEDVDKSIIIATDAAVQSTEIEYYLSTSATSPVGGIWLTTAPEWQQSKYMFSRTKITLSTGIIYKPSVNGTNISGAKGESSYTHLAYATGPAGQGIKTAWFEAATYIGMYVDNIATDSTVATKYKWSLIKGADGANGIAGPKGTDGKTAYLHIAYATSANGATGFSTTVSAGKTYIGQYTDNELVDSQIYTKYNWLLIKGETGATGATGNTGATGAVGQGVDTITEQYAVSTSKTVAPTTWTTVMPVWSYGLYVWSRSMIKYKNPVATEYTTPIVDSSWEAVNNINVGGRNLLPANINNIRDYTTNTWKTPTDMPLILSVKASQWVMIYLNHPDIVNLGEYVLSFSMRKISGIVNNIGGHSSPHSTGAITIDGKLIEGIWGNGVPYPDDILWHRVSVVITSAVKNNFIYIQVDRGTAYTNISSVEINGIKLERGNKATDWTPAPEDVSAAIQGSLDIGNSITNEFGLLKAETKVLTEIGGKISGWKNLNNGNTSSFDILADNFSIGNSGVMKKPFSIVGSDITFNGKVSFNSMTDTEVIDKAVNDINNLEIGGKNTLRDSNNFNRGGAYLGALISITESYKVPEWSCLDATLLTITGGTHTLKTTPAIPTEVDTLYSVSFWVKNIGLSPVRINLNGFTINYSNRSLLIEPGFSGRLCISGLSRSAPYPNFQFQLWSTEVSDTIKIVLWRMMLEKGNKTTDWSPALEDVQGEINQSLITANTEAGRLAGNALSSAKTYSDDLDKVVKGAFKDGIIEQAEAAAIRTHIARLAVEKDEVAQKYTTIYTNSNLLGTAKTNLASANTAYTETYNSLVTYIVLSISNNKITAAQNAEIITRFATYQSALKLLTQRFEEANASIINQAEIASKLYTDSIEIGGRNLLLNSNFADGNLTNWYNNGSVTFATIDGKNCAYMNVSNGIYQTGPAPETSIYTVSFDAKALDTSTAVRIGYLNVAGANKILTLNTSWNRYSLTTDVVVSTGQIFHIYSQGKRFYITNIKVEKGNKATDWTPAPEDIQQDIIKSLADAKTYSDNLDKVVKGAFKDGIIEQAEAKAIRTHIAQLTSEKDETTQKYTTLYANTSLLGVAKTNLASAMTAYTTAHTSLVSYITSSISNGAVTAAQSAVIDTRFTAYQTALKTLTQRFEEATSSIIDKAESNATATAGTLATAAKDAAIDWSKVKDTRSVNSNPNWYRTNYNSDTAREFKTLSIIGLSAGGTYCYVETIVKYGDSSGGAVTQSAYTDDNRMFTRVGTTTTWTAWVESESSAGAQAKATAALDAAKIDAEARAKVARDAAAAAQKTANDATLVINDIGADNKLTPVEKQSLLISWTEIQKYNDDSIARALSYGVSSANYAAAFTALSNYITPILLSMTTTTTIVRSTFNSHFSLLFTRRSELDLAIANKADLNDKIVVIDGSTKKFISPVGYSSNGATGYLIIETPITPSRMIKVHISGYNYQGSKSSIDLSVGCYVYTNNTFINYDYTDTGTYPIGNVRLAAKDGKAVIIVGNANSVWSYPKIEVTSAIIGYTNPPDSYKDGWNIRVSTSIADMLGVITIDNNSSISLQGIHTNVYYPATTEINGGNIRTKTIAADSIVANSITAGQIAANTITGDKLVANTITAREITVANLSAISANMGTITSGSIKIGSNFNVTTAGVLTASSGNFTGVVNATSGSFTGAINATSGSFKGDITSSTININNKFKVDSSGNMTATSGTFGGDIQASQIKNVTSLSSLSANIGTLTTTDSRGTFTYEGSKIVLRDNAGKILIEMGLL